MENSLVDYVFYFLVGEHIKSVKRSFVGHTIDFNRFYKTKHSVLYAIHVGPTGIDSPGAQTPSKYIQTVRNFSFYKLYLKTRQYSEQITNSLKYSI